MRQPIKSAEFVHLLTQILSAEENIAVVRVRGSKLIPLELNDITELVMKHIEGYKESIEVRGTEGVYLVTSYDSGVHTCTCPMYLQRFKICHHIKQVMVRVTKEKPEIIVAQVDEMITAGDKILMPMFHSGHRSWMDEQTKKNVAFMIERNYSVVEVKEMLNLDMGSGKLFDAVTPYFAKKEALDAVRE